MSVKAVTATTLALLAATLPCPLSLPAQEVIDLPGRDQRMDADFEEVFRVGVVDGEPWEMFGTVHYAGFDANGNLYIVDGLGGMMSGLGGMMSAALSSGGGISRLGSEGLRIMVFDASGNFVRRFGSAGEGPGEFNMPAGFAVMRDGTTVVSDAGHRAYQLFDANGEFQRMVRGSDSPGGLPVSGRLHPDPRGGAVFTGGFGSGMTVVRSSDGGAPEPPTSRPVTRIGLDGEVAHTDTVAEGWLPPRGEAAGLPKNIKLSGGGNVSLASALSGITRASVFEPPLLAGVLPDGGIVLSDSSAYALKITSPDAGEVARIIRRPLRPEPVTPATEKEYKEKQEAARRERGFGGSLVIGTVRASGGGSPSGSNQSFTIDMPEPDFFPEIPILRGLATTWEGRIWVQRRGDEPQSDGPIDVVTDDGQYVGTFATGAIEMPDAFGPHGMAAFIELDEFDVASVVVRRLPAAVR